MQSDNANRQNLATRIADVATFALLASLANPFEILAYGSFQGVLLCVLGWFILVICYDPIYLGRHILDSQIRSIALVYFGALLLTGSQLFFEVESSLIYPTRYSVYTYHYGVLWDTDNDGDDGWYSHDSITKGPYPINAHIKRNGSDEVPKQIEEFELDKRTRESFFFWQASGIDLAGGRVAFPVRIFFRFLEHIVVFVLPDFFLIMLGLASLAPNPKSRKALIYLSDLLALARQRNMKVRREAYESYKANKMSN